MNHLLSPQRILLIFAAATLVLVGGRLIKSNLDCSYFIVAGSDFTNAGKTPSPITVQKGQGYDGQFFYRYALNPFSFNAGSYGVHVDHPAYRQQRIAYPMLAWLASLGGIPSLVPFTLLLVNILAFLGIGIFMQRLVLFLNGPPIAALYPLLLCGLYLSLSRDLAEVVELFFFTGAIFYLFTARYLLCSIFLSLTLLTRDTSVIGIAPLLAGMCAQTFKKRLAIRNLFFFISPFLLFAAWKIIIYCNIPSVTDAAAGYVSYGLPFNGIIMGLKENMNFSDIIHILQFAFWIIYLLWQVYFVIIVLRAGTLKNLRQMDGIAILKIIYLAWLVVAICLSDNIYGDDWGFVRVFSLWNMVGLVILLAERKHLGRIFGSVSMLIMLLTIARLIVRV